MTSVGVGVGAVNGRPRLRGGKQYGSPEAKKAATANQRARIFEAVVALVASKGYTATTLNDIAHAAGTSKSVIGEKVGNKEQCFLWVLDRIVLQAIGNANLAYEQESEWEDKLTSGFAVFVDEVLNQTDAARVSLVEAFAGGPGAFARVARA